MAAQHFICTVALISFPSTDDAGVQQRRAVFERSLTLLASSMSSDTSAGVENLGRLDATDRSSDRFSASAIEAHRAFLDPSVWLAQLVKQTQHSCLPNGYITNAEHPSAKICGSLIALRTILVSPLTVLF